MIADDYRTQIGGRELTIWDASGNYVVIPTTAIRDLISDLLTELGVPSLPDLADLVIAAPDANLQALIELGNEWRRPAKRRSPAMHRIYFEPLPGWWGLLIESGSNARFRGESITELEARTIIARFRDAKIYFDVTKTKFHGVNIDHDAFAFIVEQIRTLERREPLVDADD